MLARIDGISFLELIIEPQYILKQKTFFMGHTVYVCMCLCMYVHGIQHQESDLDFS